MKRKMLQDTSHLATLCMQQFRSRITRSKSFLFIVRISILLLIIGVSTFYPFTTSVLARVHKSQTSQITGTPNISTRVQSSVGGGSSWPMFLHDLQHTSASNDTTFSTANVAQLTRLWSFPTGGTIAASATEVNGVVYVGSWDGYEYALNATTGAMIWKVYLGITTADPNCFPPILGITSTAAVLNGVVYVGGGDSYWYALDASTGAVLWKLFTGDNSATGGYYNWSSPLLYNGYVYIGIASEGDCPLIQGQLLKVNLTTHAVEKTYDFVPAGQAGGGLWTSPALDPTTNTLYVATGTDPVGSQAGSQAVVGIDATTLTLTSFWKVPQSETVSDSDFGTSPVLYTASGNPMLVVTNKNGIVYALNRNNLAAGPVWQDSIAIGGEFPVGGDGSISSPSYDGKRIYVAGGKAIINGIYYNGSIDAIDPTTGNFLWRRGEAGVVIGATASDNGLVFANTGNMFEVLDASTGARLYNYATGGQIYNATSEGDGTIFVGSTDDNIYAFSLGTPIQPPPDPNCPSGWTCQDVGNPAPAGLESVSNGTWSVTVGGNGISGSSDQFRLAAQGVKGDTQITAQVASQQTTGGTAQAGLMVRQSNDPASPYFSVFLSQGKGVVAQHRSAWGGGTTTDVQTTITKAPLYLEIQRIGDQFEAATSTDGVKYTLLPGSTANVIMPNAVLEGLATSSGVSGTNSTATYSAVTIGQPITAPTPTPPTNPCPTGWNCQDIGNRALVGNQSLSGNTWTLQGAGSDIWFYSDQFHYVWQSLPADGGVSAQVVTQTYTNPWVKTGVMLRQSTDPASPYYAVLATPSNGIVVQYRDVQGGNSVQVAATTGTVPTYLWAVHKGTTFSAYTSTDGVSWTLVPGSSISLNITGMLLAGIATTSHDATVLGTVTFNAVNIGTTMPMNSCPTSWNCQDIGTPALVGNQSLSGNTWTLQGAGSDIWFQSDQFHYVWQSLPTDGGVSAQVVTQTYTNPWVKTGVMLRQSTDPASPYYAVLATPSNGIVVQYRATQGGNSVQVATATGTVPTYLWAVRSGTTFSAYTSTDGVSWTLVPGSSISLSITGTLLAGIATTSHDSTVLGTVTFNAVNIGTTMPSTTPPTNSCPTSWTCQDIGTPALVGSQSLSGNTWTLQGAGSDIWFQSDQFHYVWQSLPADGGVSAQVVTQTYTNPWVKTGVMLRQSTDPASPYYAVLATPSNGIVVQYRDVQGGNSVQVATATGTVPTYLWAVRSGTTFSAYTSTDGVSWTLVPGSSISLNITGMLLAGMATTSHDATVLGTVTFNAVNVGTTKP